MKGASKKHRKKPVDSKKTDLVEKVQETSTPTPEPTPTYATAKPEPIDIKKAQDIIFAPNVGPQTDFLAASEQEVLYGGAAGGGKSYAMVADPVRYFNALSGTSI